MKCSESKLLDEICDVATVAFMSARGENGAPITNPMNPQYSCEAVVRYIITAALSAAEVHGYALARRTPEESGS